MANLHRRFASSVIMANLHRRFNDCVYGIIVVPEYCQKVISTPLFQRLRRVKQCGNLDLAWPSAVHTRYEHSIGTMHLAEEASRYLGLSENETRALVLASCLHDVAHGPYSHAFERAIVDTPSNAMFVSHDDFRYRLIREDQHLYEALGDWVEDVASVWSNKPHPTNHFDAGRCAVLHHLLSGDIGVDRMDYLIRDSYHTTPQRRIDRTCVQSILLEMRIEDGQLTVTKKGKRFVDHMLSEREYMYHEVYCQRRAAAADNLLMDAMKAGLEPFVREFLTPDKFEILTDAFVMQMAWFAPSKAIQTPLQRMLRGQV